MPRVVLDTSVLVSAIISDGKSRDLMRRGIDRQFSMVESDQILKELVSVLRRPKFETSEEEIDRIILALRGTAEVVEVIGSLMAPKPRAEGWKSSFPNLLYFMPGDRDRFEAFLCIIRTTRSAYAI